jgi:mannose-1-phosphate guanylyltransferase
LADHFIQRTKLDRGGTISTSLQATSLRNDHWAVILAGGEGTRLRSMTRAIAGDDRPKQFCPIVGTRTLLEQTRQRVARSIDPSRTMFVVTKRHERFYEPLADKLPNHLLLEQPENRGTAAAILYALFRIAARSPRAVVAFFPSDHHFSDDQVFMSHVDLAFEAARTRPETVVLLGITPSGAEVEYGWIEPHESILSSMPGSITRVQRFWEKPTAAVARNLMDRGCLWNSFVIVGRVDALLKMTEQASPGAYDLFAENASAFGTTIEPNAVRKVYSKIPEVNFSHDVLAKSPDNLMVMRVGGVEWSDLGEPTRVLSTLARVGVRTELTLSAS